MAFCGPTDYTIGTLDMLKACDTCADIASYSAVYRFCSLFVVSVNRFG